MVQANSDHMQLMMRCGRSKHTTQCAKQYPRCKQNSDHNHATRDAIDNQTIQEQANATRRTNERTSESDQPQGQMHANVKSKIVREGNERLEDVPTHAPPVNQAPLCASHHPNTHRSQNHNETKRTNTTLHIYQLLERATHLTNQLQEEATPPTSTYP